MWRTQVRMGMIPYYMFVERDTGPQGYFAVPLARATRGLPRRLRERLWAVPDRARAVHVGHARARSAWTGWSRWPGEKVFALHMIQARDPELVGRPFFARYDPKAIWLSDLRARVRLTVPLRVRAGQGCPASGRRQMLAMS